MITTTRADLHCYHCGYIAGTIEETTVDGQPIGRLIAPRSGPGIVRSGELGPRCGRCGGPLFVADAETVRVREEREMELLSQRDSHRPPPKALKPTVRRPRQPHLAGVA